MKKAMLTIGLFSMMLVLTSFTTPSNFNITIATESNIVQNGTVLPSYELKSNEPTDGTVFPTVEPKKKNDESHLNFDIADSNNEPGGGANSWPKKVD